MDIFYLKYVCNVGVGRGKLMTQMQNMYVASKQETDYKEGDMTDLPFEMSSFSDI